MPYTKQTWQDGEAGGTPLSAARLNHMEDGIDDAHTDIAELGVVDRAKVTANQGSISGETDITGLTLTVDVAASRLLKIEHYCTDFQGGNSGDVFVLLLTDGSNNRLQARRVRINTIGTNSGGGTLVHYFDSGAGGSLTFKMRAVLAGGTGNGIHVAATDAPATLTVTDVGAA